jgi:hypothetical protein
VEVGDGCATVTGYRLPKPLFARREWEGGSEIGSPKSGYRFSCARRAILPASGRHAMASFSVKEKDETSPDELFFARAC